MQNISKTIYNYFTRQNNESTQETIARLTLRRGKIYNGNIYSCEK